MQYTTCKHFLIYKKHRVSTDKSKILYFLKNVLLRFNKDLANNFRNNRREQNLHKILEKPSLKVALITLAQ